MQMTWEQPRKLLISEFLSIYIDATECFRGIATVVNLHSEHHGSRSIRFGFIPSCCQITAIVEPTKSWIARKSLNIPSTTSIWPNYYIYNRIVYSRSKYSKRMRMAKQAVNILRKFRFNSNDYLHLKYIQLNCALKWSNVQFNCILVCQSIDWLIALDSAFHVVSECVISHALGFKWYF